MTPKKQTQPGAAHATVAGTGEGVAPLLGARRQLIADARRQVLRAVDVVQVQPAFPIHDARRRELSWTHHRLPSRLDSKAAP